MELPPALRQAIDKALAGIPTARLAQDVARLSQLYRGDAPARGFHVGTAEAARAYLAARLPATYAAGHAALAAVAARRPDFAPGSLLDLGSGPGTLLWAASETWPSIASAELVEGSAAMREAGTSLAALSAVPGITWHQADVQALPALKPADLVTAGYLLNELNAASLGALVDRAWAVTADTIIFIEPGTPAGYRRVLAVRDRLIGAGARILAPCTHALPCPLDAPDWCHFSQRVARSRLHRQAKGAEVPWEDERFIYVAASRAPPPPAQARIIAPVKQASGHLSAKLCMPSGDAEQRTFSRRDGERYRLAKRLSWGDTLDA